jgi:aspartate 1-decarboxylase
MTMLRHMLKSKIHRATVTHANLNYSGSITIDEELMEEADIIDNEKVFVVDINNGNRFETYAQAGKKGSGEICLNGGGARMVQVGDLVIIITFVSCDENEIKKHKSKVIHLDVNNKIVHIKK